MEATAGIGATLVIRGELFAEEDITIAGRVEGSINVQGYTVVVQPGATIEADVHARQIVVAGRTIGMLLAEERIELRSTAEIDGDISARRLAIADGAGMQGRIQMPA